MPGLLRFFVVWLLLTTGPLAAEERLALVIGNSAYGTVSPLDNPSNDARLIAGTLDGLGFEVTALIDATQIEMKRGIAQFGRDLRKAGSDATGLFYYAGHGVQSFGTNYLLPVDVALSNAADLDLVAVEAQSVLRQMYSARNRTNIMILDACRNNPFQDIPDFNDSGLAEMQAPTGTFLAYATAPGGVALDGLDGNSPFTSALAGNMTTPGLAIEQMFKQVRVAVLEQTAGSQTPWDASSLTSDFVFVPKQEQTTTAAEIEELQVWRAVQASADPVQLMLFLRGYPDGAYADEARRLLAAVMETELAENGKAEEPAPTQGPGGAEQKMFEAAQADGSITGYQAYLQAYPRGTYAEFAEFEIAALRNKTTADPQASPDDVRPAPEPAPEPVKTTEAGPVTFASPLPMGQADLDGLSLERLVAGTPLYAPIEGLPEAYWKNQTCSNCHQWTKETLCAQADGYLSLNMQRSLDKQHPYGGKMKQAMKSWAAGGCQ